jgi:aromatic-L-amino-acid/L-tryptophan decarboxylase
MTYPLEPDDAQMRLLTQQALDELVPFIEDLPSSDAAGIGGGDEFAAGLREPVPEAPGQFGPLLDTAIEAARRSFNTTGPGYMAFIPGGGLFTSALGDFIARVLNRFVNLYSPSPGFAQMEDAVIRWIADEFHYPASAKGLLTTGGSLANFSAVVASRKAKLPEDFLSGTIYVSDQVHASVLKAALLAGFPERAIRIVPTTDALRMDVDALHSMIKHDRDAGSHPFCVVASAGTTNTGAVDPLRDVVEVGRGENLWVHIDGAYGGFFQLTARGAALLQGIEDADSITLDPHKGMFLPYGTGCLLVRDGPRLPAAHRVGADYLQDLASAEEIPNFAEYGPELSRDPRGLRLWLPIKLHGMKAFRDALDEKLDLAGSLYEAIRDVPGLVVPWEPDLTVVPFRAASGDDATKSLFRAINESGRVFMSSTVIDGQFTIRACILCHRTHRDRVQEAAEIIREAAGILASS